MQGAYSKLHCKQIQHPPSKIGKAWSKMASRQNGARDQASRYNNGVKVGMYLVWLLKSPRVTVQFQRVTTPTEHKGVLN